MSKEKSNLPQTDYIAPSIEENYCMIPANHFSALLLNYKLSGVDFKLFVLLYIGYNTESKKQNKSVPYYVSYTRLMEICGTTKKTIIASLRMLENGELISRVNERMGRAKYGYVVNNKLLNELAEQT